MKAPKQARTHMNTAWVLLTIWLIGSTSAPGDSVDAIELTHSSQFAGNDTGKTFMEDDREVYILTSRIRGRWMKVGPMVHASIAICPRGVSPIVYENGIPVSNCRVCEIYGTKTGYEGFFREGKRIDVEATQVYGVSASTIEHRIRCHSKLNIPLLNDCRHSAIEITGAQGGGIRRRLAVLFK